MTEHHPIDRATSLERGQDGVLHGETIPEYGNLVGPFGGAIAATMLRAALDHDDRNGDPIALTVNYCGAIADGAFEVTANARRTGKYTQHWSVELTQNGDTRATATVVCGRREAAFDHQPAAMPDVAAPEAIEPLPTAGGMAWLQRYAFRFVEGAPPFAGKPATELQSSRTAMWINDLPERPLDYLSLAALSDSFILRLFQVRGILVPMGTVSLTTYFHGTADEIAAQGAAPLLGIADAKRFNGNFHDQHMELWSRDGTLLASGIQVVWFKE